MEVLNPNLETLLQQHASAGLVLDANLLVLFLIGRTRRALIAAHKRSAVFTEEDYDALEEIVSRFQLIATTPNVLTEVSNLCGNLTGDDKQRYLAAIGSHVNLITEEYIPSKNVIATPAFSNFGLSDAVLADVCARQLLILTVDLRLYQFLVSLGLPAINFNHIRTSYWSKS